MFFCFWTHAEADSHVIAHFRAPPNREEKENQHHPKGDGKSNTTQSGWWCFPPLPSCCLDLLLLWIVALSPLRRLGRCCFPLPPFGVGRLGLLLLSIVLPSSSSFGWFPEKKAPAQRAHGRKHHYPNEGEAKQPHSQGSGEENQHHPKGEEKK